MEIFKEGVDIYNAQPFGLIVCPGCCSNIGNSCSGHAGCVVMSNGVVS